MSDFPAILYVEDNAMNRTVMSVLLCEEMKLNNVVIFEDSDDFVERVKALPFIPDIVFLDIHVEPIDGFEMLVQLRAMSPFATCPIVAVTASVMNDEIAQLKSAGFNGVIAKPINLDLFPDYLKRLLNGQEIWRVN